ncbi:mite allergen Der p 7-like [Periplaneta americana]|uniref:mite allergen Der p 7-like n=1 Tax=Periplaneta americana TaxID=6978 RepID=UPI0037E84BA6
MRTLVLTVAFLALAAFASGKELPKDALLRQRALRITANANEYFDSVVARIQNYAVEMGLDPLHLPDQKQEFSVQGVILEWHGELDLTNGYLQDIKTLNRDGDVLVDYDHTDLTISAKIAFGDLKLYYDYLAQIMDVGPTGQIEGIVTDLNLYVVIKVNLEELTVALETFEIEHTGTLEILLHGNGLLDIIADAIVGIVDLLFKDVIMGVVETEVKKVLEDALSQIHLGRYA